MQRHHNTAPNDPPPAPPVDDGIEDNFGGFRAGGVWTGGPVR